MLRRKLNKLSKKTTVISSNNEEVKPMIDKSGTMTEKQIQIFQNTLQRCGECVDLHGWRYNKDLGFEDYVDIDTNNKDHQKQFYVCVKFLRTHFPTKGRDETVSSFRLRNAAEQWWYNTFLSDIAIDNGIMLVAIVACGLCPLELWHSMELEQKAVIKIDDWNKLCMKYNNLNNFDEI